MASKNSPGGRRIVVVDDDESTAIIIQYNCEAAGHRVDCIADGRDAADAILRNPPDLVVLDWVLPGISGIELLRRLRSAASTRHLPVVMVTARVDPQDRAFAIASGADAALPKTVTVGSLMACISALLSPDRDIDRSVAERGQEIGP